MVATLQRIWDPLRRMVAIELPTALFRTDRLANAFVRAQRVPEFREPPAMLSCAGSTATGMRRGLAARELQESPMHPDR